LGELEEVLVVVVGRIGGGITRKISQEREMGQTCLWMFFLIYCLTFSFLFLFNVRLRLVLGFLAISPSSESLHHMSRSPSGWCEPSALGPSSTLLIV